jgi:hypothetical protein
VSRRPLRSLALAGALALAAGCAGSTEPTGGLVSVILQGPAPARAVLFRLVGPHQAITVPSGYPFRVYPTPGTGDTVIVAVVANQGQLLTGAIVTTQVPNVRTPPTFTLLQVAAADYSLPNAALYSVVIHTP